MEQATNGNVSVDAFDDGDDGAGDLFFPGKSRLLRWHGRLRTLEAVVLLIALPAVALHVGFVSISQLRIDEVGLLVLSAMTVLCATRVAAYLISQRPGHTGNTGRSDLVVPGVWAVVCTLLVAVSILSPTSGLSPRGWSEVMAVTELALIVISLSAAMRAGRIVAGRTQNSALLLVGSFLLLITIGTLLLRLPVCRAQVPGDNGLAQASWQEALFTATSASCVTGLIVVDTGSYWSTTGQIVIFCLFQTGGLGILTFGAFVAILSGRRGIRFRESATLGSLLDLDDIRSARRLLITIVLFTLGAEAVGALLMMGLWADRPAGEQLWFSVFHSVSAFCNAGFSLHDEGFLGKGGHWQVWGPLTMLIILGGLGFAVVEDVYRVIRSGRDRTKHLIFRRNSIRPRLTVHSRIVLWTAAVLLLCGTIGVFTLESFQSHVQTQSTGRQLADAWFQSVTFRTAGFNTVDHAQMHPATKLLAVFLMFIGAAPGSTGGGVKTVVFALTILNVWSVIRGRSRVEVFGRSLPANQVARSLAIIAVGIGIVLTTAGLLAVFEDKPDRFVDYLFEATSAFATVGVSAGVTSGLSDPSRLLIVVVMFLGRVGPITMLLAMAGNVQSISYDYPEERVSLG
ncbi:MAG: potassium-transporting ATPase subunit KdpA [Planctomycetaceae bacterium]|nr:potassium-transporting ATPase subunit KdpA [Planctomycetaceae bacterium]